MSNSYQRAIAQARKLEPATVQQGQSLFFSVASTSVEGGIHHVSLGSNRANVLFGAKCDCGQSKYGCCHRAASLLQFVSNLEARLWLGADLIVQAEDFKTDTTEGLEAKYALFQDLLSRYEFGIDLIRAIEAGEDINKFRIG